MNRVGFLGLLLIFGYILATSPAFAQEEHHYSGEIEGGMGAYFPIQMNLGQRVEGEFIAVSNEELGLGITDSTRNIIYDFGTTTTGGSFWYAAGYEGQYYLVVINTAASSVETKSYQITWRIVPYDGEPNSGSGMWVSPGSGDSSIMPFVIIGGIGAVAVLILAIYLWRKKKQRELRRFYWARQGRFYRYSIQQLEEEIRQIRDKKRQLERRMDILGRARPKVVLYDEDHTRLDSMESEISILMLELKQLDAQEEALREVLADKMAGRDYSHLFG